MMYVAGMEHSFHHGRKRTATVPAGRDRSRRCPPARCFKKWHLRKVRDIVGKLVNNLSKLAVTIFTLEWRAASLDLADDG